MEPELIKPEAAARASYALNEAEQQTLLTLARRSIAAGLEKGEPDLDDLELTPALQIKMSCFVTLKKRGQLRGCIGTLNAHRRLYEDVIDNAQSAAFRDPRFPKLKEPEELEKCQIEISVLTPPSAISGVDDIEIGKHGLVIEKGGQRGVFLPQVPVEQKWDLTKYLENLCRKAGLPRDAYQEGAKLQWFTAQVFAEEE